MSGNKLEKLSREEFKQFAGPVNNTIRLLISRVDELEYMLESTMSRLAEHLGIKSGDSNETNKSGKDTEGD